MVGAVVVDPDGVYDPALINDRLLLGLKGTMAGLDAVTAAARIRRMRGRLKEMATTHVRYGYRRLAVLLRRDGCQVNTKWVYRIYTEEGLAVRTKHRKKIARGDRVPAPTRFGPISAGA